MYQCGSNVNHVQSHFVLVWSHYVEFISVFFFFAQEYEITGTTETAPKQTVLIMVIVAVIFLMTQFAVDTNGVIH